MIEHDALVEAPVEPLVAGTTQFLLYARDLRIAVHRERVRARQLAALHERLLRLDRMKSDFLALIFHELRTPLAHLSNVDLLDATTDSTQRLEIIDVLRHGHERLGSLVTKAAECFEWSALTEVDRTKRLDMLQVVEAAACDVPTLRAPDVDWRVRAGGAAFFVGGDAVALQRAVVVLLDNAVRYSPQRKTIDAALHEHADAIELSVWDRGIGLPPELAGEIFEPFTIADVAQLADGSGLGLATASAIARAHGGQLSARSREDGVGSVFTLQLPKYRHKPLVHSAEWDEPARLGEEGSRPDSAPFDGTAAAGNPTANS